MSDSPQVAGHCSELATPQAVPEKEEKMEDTLILEAETDDCFLEGPDPVEEEEESAILERVSGDNGDGESQPCEVCDIILATSHAHDLHVNGKAHQRAMRLRKNFEVLTDPNSMKIVEDEPTILKSLKEIDEPLIGLNYLIEFVHKENNCDSSPVWVCVLCQGALPTEVLVKDHFVGKRHRYRYLSKHFPEMSKSVHVLDKSSDKTPLCQEYATKVEEMEGGKKFESIQVAVNPNKAKFRGDGPAAKRKPISLLDMKAQPPPFMNCNNFGPHFGRPHFPGNNFNNGFGARGPGHMGRSSLLGDAPFLQNRPYQPSTMQEIIPIIENVPVNSYEDREFLIQASQLLEQKLVDFNNSMGVDPYDGIRQLYENYQQATEKAMNEPINTDNGAATADTIQHSANSNLLPSPPKKPISLLDLPVAPVLSWASKMQGDV